MVGRFKGALVTRIKYSPNLACRISGHHLSIFSFILANMSLFHLSLYSSCSALIKLTFTKTSLGLTQGYLYCEEPESSLWQLVGWLVSFGAEATNSLIPSE
jgi:hypothetical protein